MDKQTEHQLSLLAAEIRDDVQRAEQLGKASVGLWALMAYANRLENLLADRRAGHDGY